MDQPIKSQIEANRVRACLIKMTQDVQGVSEAQATKRFDALLASGIMDKENNLKTQREIDRFMSVER